MTRFVLIVSAVIGCTPRVPTVEDEISIELSGVRLAEDCNGRQTVPPPPPAPGPPGPPPARGATARVVDEKPAAMEAAPGACADPANCARLSMRGAACEQSSMQIAITARGQKATIKIKRVELLDSSGKFLAELAASVPTKWNGSAYVTWDEAISGVDLAVSYQLASPDWNKLTNGRWNAASKRFHLRVIVAVGDTDRTIDSRSIMPVMPEPEVVT